MIFEKHANLKYKYGKRHFWCRGYYVDTVGKNTAAIKAYIQNPLIGAEQATCLAGSLKDSKMSVSDIYRTFESENGHVGKRVIA